MKLSGKCAIITGSNQGLGFAIAKQFILNGASVMLCARDKNKLIAAKQELELLALYGNNVLAEVADVSDQVQVNNLVAKAIKAWGKIDILVANAGIYGPKGNFAEIDWHEWSRTIDINLKGGALPAQAVLPYMKKNKFGKIIFISGGGATKPLPGLSAYAASKAAVVRFSETLADELREFNIDVNAVAPGALNTRLLDEILAAGSAKVGEKFYQQALQQKNSGGTALSVGAGLCVFLASSESDRITGKLISAVWDPWENLPNYLAELINSDIYTLRRIIPEDRDQIWSEIT